MDFILILVGIGVFLFAVGSTLGEAHDEWLKEINDEDNSNSNQ